MTATRIVSSIAALLGTLSLAQAAAAQPHAAPAAQPPTPPQPAVPQPAVPQPAVPQPAVPPLAAVPQPAAPPQAYAPSPPPAYAPAPGNGPLGAAGPPGAPYAPPILYVALPRTLAYRENQEAPPGYRLEARTNRSMILAGAAVFASAWSIAALVGGTILSERDRDADGYGPLLVPVVGPFMTLGTGEELSLADEDTRLGGILVLVNGITQVTGAVLMVAGMLSEQKVWVRNDIPQRVGKSGQPQRAASPPGSTPGASGRPPAPSAPIPEIAVGPGGGALRFRF